MALAEPRRRTKWTLNPRGNIWANDTNKFGHKLMEKMGWEAGKGLGANQDGRIAPVTLRHKDDAKGIGFQGHDDTWLAHQDDFQAVLAALNTEHGTQADTDATEEVQGSLEATSKSSKKRVHYQKFTRGKDLKNYSADDLGCILGTKSEKRKNKKKERKEMEEAAEADGTEVGKEEKSHGLVTIQGGNYQDYFKKKMADLKARGKITYTPEVFGVVDENEEEEEETEPKMVGFKTEEKEVEEEENIEIPEKKKKKKKSKSEDKEEEITAEPEKKKKKNKDKIELTEEVSEEIEVEKTKKKKNKKGKKEKTTDIPEEKENDSGCEEEETKQKKKKKGKKEKVEKESSEKKRKAEDDNNGEKKKKKSAEENVENAPKEDSTLGSTRSNLLAMAGYGI